MTAKDDFLKSIKTRHTSSLIPILDIPNYYDAIVDDLRNQGLFGQELSKEIPKNLRAICPICHTWADSARLSTVSWIRKEGRENVRMTRYGPVSRLLDGRCQSSDCSSNEILLIWRSQPEIEIDIATVIQRLDNEKKKPIQQFLRPDIIAYTIDAILDLKLSKQPADIYTVYTGRNFGDIYVWISLIPSLISESSIKKYIFPQGYLNYFEQLMLLSGWDSGNIAVMHWIYAPYFENQLFCSLSFIAEKNLNSESSAQADGIILPLQLLNDEEKRHLGLH